MQPEKIDQIKGLIKASRILNESERAEWLSLLELMNDKQLGELEKILNSGERSASSTQHLVDRNKQEDSQPISPKPAGQSASFQPVRPHLPSLSHIMNLPKNMNGQVSSLKLSQKTMGSQAVNPPVKDLSPSVAISSKTVKTKQNFADKLKAIFAEKELPAGKPKNELSLPEHTIQQKVAPVVPVKPKPEVVMPASVKPPASKFFEEKPAVVKVPAEKPAEKPTVVTASQVIIQGPVTFTKRDGASGGGMIISQEFKDKVSAGIKIPPIAPIPKVVAQPLPDKNPPVIDLEAFLAKKTSPLPKVSIPEKPKTQIKPEDSHKPGLNIQEISEKVRIDTLAGIKQRMSESVLSQKPESIKIKDEKPVELHWPKDLTLLTLASFKKSSLENYVKAIRHLIEKFGYYDVIFNLEKSTLYDIYIKTGVELMNKQQTFETFDTGQTIDAFLDREEFEKFTDLLRMIASS